VELNGEHLSSETWGSIPSIQERKRGREGEGERQRETDRKEYYKTIGNINIFKTSIVCYA
jgi:50S ribosomal subunit-associated GTPase HflX